MILPASTVYAVYLIVLVAIGRTKFSLLLLVLYGLLIGVQIVVFLVRSRYDFFFWFIYFTLIGVPVFYFVLPLYAFWHMDDFSWGETRKVAAMQNNFNNPALAVEKEEDDYSTGSDRSGEGSEGYDDDDYSREEDDEGDYGYDRHDSYGSQSENGSRRSGASRDSRSRRS
jgi:chitin synthase